MNFSASMALSLFLHGAVAVIVIAAPEPQERDVEALDAFVEERVIEFDPVGVVPREVRMVHVARADEGDPDEPNVEETKPEPESKPEPEKEPKRAPDTPEPRIEPVDESEKTAKPVVAARDSEASAETREIADASDGVNDTRPTDGDVGATSRRAPTTGNHGAETGSARGTDRGSEGIDRAALLRTWLKEIYVQLQKRQRYPRAARRSRQQGKVVLQVWIDRRGEVVRAEIGDTSGHATLDRAALRLIKSITPVPPPPSELRWSTRPIKLPVTYKLR